MTRLAYIHNIAMPGPEANTVNVAKMCDAFAANGAAVTLIALPDRGGNDLADRIRDRAPAVVPSAPVLPPHPPDPGWTSVSRRSRHQRHRRSSHAQATIPGRYRTVSRLRSSLARLPLPHANEAAS